MQIWSFEARSLLHLLSLQRIEAGQGWHGQPLCMLVQWLVASPAHLMALQLITFGHAEVIEARKQRKIRPLRVVW